VYTKKLFVLPKQHNNKGETMAFKKMQKPQYPPRHWSLVGYPGSGKSTFAAQMRGPKLVIDADHRFTEVLELAGDDVLTLSDDPHDNVDPDNISECLYANMPGSGVKTIIVDSLTAIITPIVVRAVQDHSKGRQRNLMAGMKDKAMAMRQLQDSVARWGTDCLWIYHLQDSRDGKAKEITRSTVSETELARLTRSINVQLKIIEQNGKRGIEVMWARKGRSGIVIWDDAGNWKGMPEKIEAALYDGLTQKEQEQIEANTPMKFPNPETAISWGYEQGAFGTVEEAKLAYAEVRKEHQPQTAEEMATFWTAEVRARKMERADAA
jgi:hypothetical protein